MKTFQLHRELELARPLSEVFPFFGDPLNLESITPAWLHFRILSAPRRELRRGDTIDYRLRLHGIPLRWRTEIADWRPPQRFVDRQLRGPYRLWVHTHEFEETATGSTLVRDQVEYAVAGGAWIDRLLVRRDLERIFDYRARRIRERFDPQSELESDALTSRARH